MENVQKRNDLNPRRPAVSYIPRVAGALITAVPYGKKKRRGLKNLPDSVGAEAPAARRPLTGKLKVERL
jgi:hypothetical protein